MPDSQPPELERGSDDPQREKDLIVVRLNDEQEDEPQARDEVQHPAKLLRIASMIQRMLHEVHEVELDEASRSRLTDIYNRTLGELAEVLSDDLRDELTDMVFHALDVDEPPTTAELHIVHAQLIGWLEGLFHGIQASIASQQMAAQQQLAHLRQQALQRAQEEDGPPRGPGGTYL